MPAFETRLPEPPIPSGGPIFYPFALRLHSAEDHVTFPTQLTETIVFEETRTVAVVGIGKKDRNHQTNLYKRLESLANAGRLADTVLETYRSAESESEKKE